MCIKSKKPEPPAASPAPPLPATTSVDVGDRRKQENVTNYGEARGPSYRVKRAESSSALDRANTSIRM